MGGRGDFATFATVNGERIGKRQREEDGGGR